jgi:ketosteroid isomerase-like protein
MGIQPNELPIVVASYQAAHNRHDVETGLTSFAEDAVVHDEDHDWAGRERIQH